jgi:hypothetical protein
MNDRPDGNHLIDGIDVLVLEAEFPDERDTGVDLLFSQMPEIKVDDVTVRACDRASPLLFLYESLGQAGSGWGLPRS